MYGGILFDLLLSCQILAVKRGEKEQWLCSEMEIFFFSGKGDFLTFSNTVGIFKNLQRLLLLFHDDSSFLYFLLAQMPNGFSFSPVSVLVVSSRSKVSLVDHPNCLYREERQSEPNSRDPRSWFCGFRVSFI